MKPLLAALALVCLSVPVAGAQEPTPITFGESFTLDSAVMGEPRTVNIWVPPDADRDPRAPYRVLYLIDGGVGQDWFHMAGLAQLGGLAWMFDPMIVVGVETEDRQNELTPPAAAAEYREEFPTSGGDAAFRRFIVEEVEPFVEARYPVSGKTTVIGESLAGLFIVDTFLTAPETFDDYIAISPSLWWDDMALGLASEAALASHDYSGKRLYLTIANEGETMQQAMDMLVAALGKASIDGLEWVYVDRSASETHATIYHGAALDALRTFYATPWEE